jgi:hypothetical protein
MKNIFCLTFLVFSLQALGNECFEQAKSFGGLNLIDEECFTTQFKSLDSQNHHHVKIQEYSIWGGHNILWIQHPTRGLLPIAGENSRLHQIIAIAGAQTSKELAVLQINDEGQHEILILNIDFPGHVKPRRVIQSPRLKHATSLSLDNTREKILVVLSQHNQVFEFQLNANDQSIHHHNKSRWERVPLEGSHRIVDIAATTDAVMALTSNNRLCTYTMPNIRFSSCLDLEIADQRLHSIRYHHHDRLLEISNDSVVIPFALD